MSEILFRGKDLQEHNGWLYGYFYKSDINKRERESGKASLIFTPNCDTFIYVPEYHNSWMVKAETVGQYTGLTDKNGKKVFEGDICWLYSIDYYSELWEHNAIVAITDMTDYEQIHYLNNAEYCEIIGNVFDSPQLLEDKNNE